MNKTTLIASFLTLLACGAFQRAAQAQLRIINYNTAGVTNSSAMQTVLSAMKDVSVNGVVKPIDVISLQELSSGDMASMVSLLNAQGAGTYVAGTVGSTTGAGGVGLIYRAESVDLIAQEQILGTSTSGAARGVMRYTLRPDGYGSEADFHIYGSHYKASDSSSDAARRNVEAAAIRANSDALGQGAHVIYTGDFNIYRSSEPMWATLTGAGNGQAFDPVNQVGSWHDGGSFLAVHTQNPAGSGFVGGGMDDRFDWQMVTGELMDNEGMSILSGSYSAFGNNGTHAINGHINSGTGASAAVLNALGAASDHLPIFAQYQVPAKMSFGVASVPSQVLKGASLNATTTVTNTAGDGVIVVNAIGADELDYTVTGSGAASGAVGGSDAAFGSGNNHNFSLDTATAGAKSASFAALATSPQVPSASQSQMLNYSVLDHATPSFAGLSELPSLVFNFGAVLQGSLDPNYSFDVFNLEETLGFTADLDFDSFLASGDTGAFLTDFAAAAGSLSILAGTSSALNVALDTASLGSYSATYNLSFSDEDLPGALTSGLSLTVTGQVVASVVPEPASWILIASAACVFGLRRRKR